MRTYKSYETVPMSEIAKGTIGEGLYVVRESRYQLVGDEQRYKGARIVTERWKDMPRVFRTKEAADRFVRTMSSRQIVIAHDGVETDYALTLSNREWEDGKGVEAIMISYVGGRVFSSVVMPLTLEDAQNLRALLDRTIAEIEEGRDAPKR